MLLLTGAKVDAELDGTTDHDDVIHRHASKGVKMPIRCHDKHSLKVPLRSYSFICKLMTVTQSLARRSRVATAGPLRSGVTAVEGREGQPTEQPSLSPLNGVVQAKGEVERQRELEMDGYYDSKEKLADGEWVI